MCEASQESVAYENMGAQTWQFLTKKFMPERTKKFKIRIQL